MNCRGKKRQGSARTPQTLGGHQPIHSSKTAPAQPKKALLCQSPSAARPWRHRPLSAYSAPATQPPPPEGPPPPELQISAATAPPQPGLPWSCGAVHAGTYSSRSASPQKRGEAVLSHALGCINTWAAAPRKCHLPPSSTAALSRTARLFPFQLLT